jgi:hypothetical protein
VDHSLLRAGCASAASWWSAAAAAAAAHSSIIFMWKHNSTLALRVRDDVRSTILGNCFPPPHRHAREGSAQKMEAPAANTPRSVVAVRADSVMHAA